MKRMFALGAAMCLFGIVAVGCQKTAEGAKQDASTDTAALKEAGDKAAVATENAAAKSEHDAKVAVDRMTPAVEKATKNASDAISLTPKVKLAIVNDSLLNNTGNLINVESGDNKVELKGHVLTERMKERATNVASRTVKASGSTDTVVNMLTVQGR